MKRLILIAALLLTACDIRGRVLMVGDSNMSMTADAYTGYLYGGAGNGTWQQPAPSYLTTFAAVPGAGFVHSADWVASLASVDGSADFDAVVLNLGVNDAMASGCTSGLDAKIDAVYGALPADVPIIVIDAPYVPSTMYSQACLVNVNLALQAAHYRWSPRTRYINVNTVLDQLPANQRFIADGTHFTQAAKYKIAEAVRVELENVL